MKNVQKMDFYCYNGCFCFNNRDTKRTVVVDECRIVGYDDMIGEQVKEFKNIKQAFSWCHNE